MQDKDEVRLDNHAPPGKFRIGDPVRYIDHDGIEHPAIIRAVKFNSGNPGYLVEVQSWEQYQLAFDKELFFYEGSG